MLLREIKELIITPSLHLTSLGGDNADILMLCTGMQETKYETLKQTHGPALGPWQVEPQTHKDIKIWLGNRMNATMMTRILSACQMEELPNGDDILIWNWRYSLLIARLVFHRARQPIPSYKDPSALAQYYCKYYNAGGAAMPETVTRLFKDVINELAK